MNMAEQKHANFRGLKGLRVTELKKVTTMPTARGEKFNASSRRDNSKSVIGSILSKQTGNDSHGDISVSDATGETLLAN